MKPRDVSMIAVAAGSLALAFGVTAGEDKMQMMDTDKDGLISASEHEAGARQKFDRMDANRDGSVTAAEMDSAYQSMGGGGKPAMSAAEKIKTIDTNNDGVLTAAEHEAGSRSMFEKMDANRDGKLSSEEMRAGHDKPR